jgi:predicted SAM-dependent methyltransferase
MAACGPDVVFDLETGSWPFPDNSVDKILAHHVLEHIDDLIHVMKEMYRVMRVGAKAHIRVPHPRSDYFLADPTHVRPIMPGTLELFSPHLERW